MRECLKVLGTEIRHGEITAAPALRGAKTPGKPQKRAAATRATTPTRKRRG